MSDESESACCCVCGRKGPGARAQTVAWSTDRQSFGLKAEIELWCTVCRVANSGGAKLSIVEIHPFPKKTMASNGLPRRIVKVRDSGA